MTEQLDTAKASEASSKLRLHTISTLGLEARALRLHVAGTKLKFSVEHRSSIWNLLPDALVCLFGLDLKIDVRDTDERAAEFSVDFRAEYRFEDSFDPVRDEHLIPHYAGIVSRLHVWPYFRAEIQSLTTKVGMPPLTLPVILAGHTVGIPVEKYQDDELPITAPELPAPAKKIASRAKKASAKKKSGKRGS